MYGEDVVCDLRQNPDFKASRWSPPRLQERGFEIVWGMGWGRMGWQMECESVGLVIWFCVSWMVELLLGSSVVGSLTSG